VEFPASLTSSDRKYVHKIAESFRLPTKSQGVGAERFLTVYKTAPEGMEQKPERPSFVPVLKLSPEAMQKLSDAAAGAPPGTGRPTLAAVRPMSGRALAEPPAAKRQKVKPVEVGDEVEGFWPDEEAEEGGTWLPATVAEVKDRTDPSTSSGPRTRRPAMCRLTMCDRRWERALERVHHHASSDGHRGDGEEPGSTETASAVQGAGREAGVAPGL
ncbi:unnamed protein product, partial [Prorocentrum cordatum]